MKKGSEPKFFSVLDKARVVYDITYKVVLVICKLLLVIDILITTYAVLGRYVGEYIPFLDDPAWSEQIAYMHVVYGRSFCCSGHKGAEPYPYDGVRPLSSQDRHQDSRPCGEYRRLDSRHRHGLCRLALC